jgi:putative FmdB family regulatory protein
MPIYEYRCQDCGKVTEVFVRMVNQEIDLSCFFCNSKNLQKIFSTPSYVRMGNSTSKGSTCCGATERCDRPPCTDGGICQKH